MVNNYGGNNMEQKHIANKDVTGAILVNKNILADLADLIRLSPTSCRVLLMFMAYADDSNSVITDIRTIAQLLGIEIKKAAYAVRTLAKNGYIEVKEVQLNHKNDIIGVIHDKKLYNRSKKKIWKVVGEKLITTYELTGTYNRFYINQNVVRCATGKRNNVLLHIKGNLFYDKRIDNNEIIWEM